MSKSVRFNDDELLDAAARLFHREGLGGASIRGIAEEAGMLPGSVTYRYPTRDDLIEALMARAVKRATQAVRAAIAGERSPRERLRKALRAHLMLLAGQENALGVLLLEGDRVSGSAGESVRRQRGRYEALWEGLMFEAEGGGVLWPGLDLDLTQRFVLGAATMAGVWHSRDGDREPEVLAEALWALIGLGVLDPARRPEDPARALTASGAMEPGWKTS